MCGIAEDESFILDRSPQLYYCSTKKTMSDSRPIIDYASPNTNNIQLSLAETIDVRLQERGRGPGALQGEVPKLPDIRIPLAGAAAGPGLRLGHRQVHQVRPQCTVLVNAGIIKENVRPQFWKVHKITPI